MQPQPDNASQQSSLISMALGHSGLPRLNYSFNAMSVGQALHLDDFKKSQSARVAAIQYVKRNRLDWKFGIRKTDNGWLILRLR